MKRTRTVVPLRAVRRLLAAASLVVASAATANAQITFAGNTSFRLGNSGAFSSVLTFGGILAPALRNGLTIKNTGFSVNTVVTNPMNPWFSTANIGSSLTNSLGSLTLRDRRNIYDGDIVQMLVTLTNPTAPAQQFSSMLTGTVYTCTACNPLQSVSIAWAPGVVSGVPYTNGPGNGWFDLYAFNSTVYLGPPGVPTAYLTGKVDVYTTPEPASMALVATGLIGMFGVARRRRSR